jgi:hypothetical protein
MADAPPVALGSSAWGYLMSRATRSVCLRLGRAGLAHATHLLDQREQAQTAAIDKVIIGHGGASF